MEINGHTEIMGIGGYVPQQKVKSTHLMEELGSMRRFGVKETFISDIIGIEERRVAQEQEKPSDMAIRASVIAMKNAGISGKDIGLVIFCGIDRDWQEPSTAHRVQNKIGATSAACFDVTNACHGFINGLSIADAMIAAGSVEVALVCTGEKPSIVMYDALSRLQRSSDRADLKRWIGGLTVGDAGGAILLQASDRSGGFLKFKMESLGEFAELCYYKHTENGIEGQMHMSEISDCMIRYHKEMIAATYENLLWSAGEVDHLVCHQVGKRPHKKMARLANVSIDKAPVTYRMYGNITSATVPVNLHFNPPRKGDKVLILGAGSGISISQTGMIF